MPRTSRSGKRAIVNGINVCFHCKSPSTHKSNCLALINKNKINKTASIPIPQIYTINNDDEESNSNDDINNILNDENEPIQAEIDDKKMIYLESLWMKKLKTLPKLKNFQFVEGSSLNIDLWPDWFFYTPNALLLDSKDAWKYQCASKKIYVICPHTFFSSYIQSNIPCPSCGQTDVIMAGRSIGFQKVVYLEDFAYLKSRRYLCFLPIFIFFPFFSVIFKY